MYIIFQSVFPAALFSVFAMCSCSCRPSSFIEIKCKTCSRAISRQPPTPNLARYSSKTSLDPTILVKRLGWIFVSKAYITDSNPTALHSLKLRARRSPGLRKYPFKGDESSSNHPLFRVWFASFREGHIIHEGFSYSLNKTSDLFGVTKALKTLWKLSTGNP